jgi:hypothetical protein
LACSQLLSVILLVLGAVTPMISVVPVVSVVSVFPAPIIPVRFLLGGGLGLALFVFPTFVHSMLNNVHIIGPDTPNEEDPCVVLHRDELGVIDSRLLGKLLTVVKRFQPHRMKAEFRLTPEYVRFPS